jgi:hypothetical protein
LQKSRCYKEIMTKHSVHDLSNEQLLSNLTTATAREREATTYLIALLAEADARQLYLGRGYSSLFVYCTRCLRLSEHAAYGRIEAARAVRKFPVVLELLADGSITLTTVCLLAGHLTAENHRAVLDAARHKSKREVEAQMAVRRPLPAVPSAIRKLPQPRADQSPVVAGLDAGRQAAVLDSARMLSPVPPLPRVGLPVVRALAPERYKVQLTIDRQTHDKLRRTQDLLRHVVPDGDPAAIFDRALTLLVQDLERKKLANVEHPRQVRPLNVHGRHVPAQVRREVWTRDGCQCAFVGTEGRCTERGFLEFHHVLPFADGGATTTDNLELRCRAHNAYEAREHFGPSLLREHSIGDELGPDRVAGALLYGVSSRDPLSAHCDSSTRSPTRARLSTRAVIECSQAPQREPAVEDRWMHS